MTVMVHMNSCVCVCTVCDVIPIDGPQQRRTHCTAQVCPLHDHMLHELDQQFLYQFPTICEQEVFNPQ